MTDAAPVPSCWQRRVIAPLRTQLTQGISPDHLAVTFAVGAACSLFPFLGFTSLLNLVVGIGLRLNQPILQILNQLLGLVQLSLILAYVRLGEWLWRAEGAAFTPADLIHTFKATSLGGVH